MTDTEQRLNEIATQLKSVISAPILVFEDDHKRYHDRKVRLGELLDKCEQVLEVISYAKEPDTLPEPIPDEEETEPEEDRQSRMVGE